MKHRLEEERDEIQLSGNDEIIQKINGQEFPDGPVFGALCFCCCRGPVPSLVWELGSPPVVRQNQRKKERKEERKKKEQKKKITTTCLQSNAV